jgi:hypothetical protein
MNPNSITYTTAMIIAFVCIIIGFAAGGFIGISSKNRRKKTDEEVAPVNPSIPSAPPLVDPAKYTELLRLWRDKEGSGLFVETSGHLLASSEPLNDRQRKRFIDLIKELSEWLKIPSTEISQNLVEPKPMQVPSNVAQPVAQQPVNVESAATVPPVPERKSNESISTAPVPPPSVPYAPPPPLIKPITKPVVEQAPKPATTMVQQIDEILQDVIFNSDTPDRKIKLVEEPNEGVVVWVDHEHFIGIDAVPDPVVKDLIRAAVKEWDRRTETH